MMESGEPTETPEVKPPEAGWAWRTETRTCVAPDLLGAGAATSVRTYGSVPFQAEVVTPNSLVVHPVSSSAESVK